MERGTNTASTTMDNPIADPDRDSIPMPIQNNPDSHESRFEPKPLLDQNELLKAIEIVEKDSLAIAESFTSLFSSLRLALSQNEDGRIIPIYWKAWTLHVTSTWIFSPKSGQSSLGQYRVTVTESI
ncbi:PREDICTED: uncharacterized protein LOC104596058 isoform X3 [Nelumbo nucifera]|uniref:Uncharacterized protein LOC104596058 isoform X3 n=1 Tax=Nelumbo nucifera TaxID=4432 RepID=A0A1U7ZTE9_NELNU|nr:PREDICTED: uncharacterized protein LOC104596058 isoform X3 [Nelumbo nucifera]